MVGWRRVALAAGLASALAFGVNCGSGGMAPCQGARCSTGPGASGGTTGGNDSGSPDAGTPDAGTDSGTPDSGTPDAGTPDAGTPDGGTNTGIPPITFGTPGPWPADQNVIYTSADGIADGPVVAVTTDEAEYLWVATEQSLYLMKPGDKTFHRFTSKDGLHLQDNPLMYCSDQGGYDASPMLPGWKCKDPHSPPVAGYGLRISSIVGGAPGEVFVGYEGVHDWNSPDDSSYKDPYHHTGMIERVRLRPDGTIQVDRFDIDASNDWHYWHDRDIWRLAYDHFTHKHALYAGTEHGVTFFLPDRFRDPNPGEDWHQVEAEYMADHLHPHVCVPHPGPDGGVETSCGDGETGQMMGDWRGLWIAPDGNLLVAGRWTAGEIKWDPNLDPNGTRDVTDWSKRGDPFVHATTFGDPYPPPGGGDPSCNENQPVFKVAKEGDVVSLTAVTVAGGKIWYASGQTYGDDVALGIASFDGCFTYYQPSQVGLGDQSVRDMVGLPDGRLAIAGPTSGVVLWDPATGKHVALDAAHGYLADNQVKHLELDTMVNPPALHVATATGASVIRVFPK